MLVEDSKNVDEEEQLPHAASIGKVSWVERHRSLRLSASLSRSWTSSRHPCTLLWPAIFPPFLDENKSSCPLRAHGLYLGQVEDRVRVVRVEKVKDMCCLVTCLV